MPYLLDTDTCSYIMKRHPLSVLKHLQTIEMSTIGISSMTLAELRYGVERLNSSRFTQQDVDLFVTHLTVFAWDAEATQYYAILRADLERKGLPIGNMDMLIAAHSLRLNAILVTNNQRHFSRIAGLKLENWVEM
ncbi:MAG: type II toxin-antitoxin system VapC family toxin [Candidatus Parabeggiatoa sp.]|nr:type II toxin-antitoxin system VapC family toxin [Candidatus Parabeggiatoa sp.]